MKGGPPVGLFVQTTSVATTGTAFSITVRAVDAYGNNAYPYLGTVRLTSSDPAATMPAGYSYAATDAAQHTFPGAVLRTVGMQTITATDPTTGLTGTTPPIQVVLKGARNRCAVGPLPPAPSTRSHWASLSSSNPSTRPPKPASLRVGLLGLGRHRSTVPLVAVDDRVATASSASSVRCNNSRSSGETISSARVRERTQSSIGLQ